MEIQNKETHKNCYCYENEKNSLIKIMMFDRGEVYRISLSTNEIVFILEGKIYFSGDSSDGAFDKGHLVFLPAGDHFCYKADASSTVLIIRLLDIMSFCPNFSIKQLFHRMKEEEKPEFFSPLEINDRLWHFAHGLVDSWQDGLKCKHYLRSEITKLLTMLPFYYSKEDLSRFFYPILSPDTTFSEFVRMNHLKYRTVNEFASAMKMTVQQFARRFHSIYRQAPYEWMQQQKARMIYSEISQGNKPLKEVAADFGFTDQSNFNRFCKTYYETTPGKIRKKKLQV